MIIKQTKDKDIIKHILTHKGIWEAVSGDGDKIDAFDPELDENIYILGEVDLQPIGLFIVHPTSFGLWQCHVQVLPEFRELHSNEFGQKVIQWVWDNTDIHKLISFISDLYPNVKRFAEQQGFIEEGNIKNFHKKDGAYHSKWVMSIERNR